jgi:hypothetical protein
MSAPTVSQVFTDLFNGLLAIVDNIALAIQDNAKLVATIVIIGAVVGAVYVFGRRLINWFRGFMG